MYVFERHFDLNKWSTAELLQGKQIHGFTVVLSITLNISIDVCLSRQQDNSLTEQFVDTFLRQLVDRL